jgi:Tfp pilus assembly protein FimV
LGGLAHLKREETIMKRSGIGLMAWIFAGGMTTAQAATPPLDEAVRVFLGQTVTQSMPNSANGAAVPHAGGRTVVVVRKGESLGRIVRAHFKGTPFRDDFIFKAFVALNPEAFPRKTHHIVTAGASLQVPTHADLMAMAEGQSPAMGGQGAPGAASSAANPAQRKHWVRFP